MKIPYPFQREGVARLLELCGKRGGAMLSDDMGLGKSFQAALTACELGKTIQGQVLVVAPAAVRAQWVSEFAAVFGDSVVAELGPASKKQFKSAWANYVQAQVIVTSYNLAEKLVHLSPAIFILDEAHNLKSRWGPWAKTCRKLAVRSRKVIALTGTPMWSRPRDYWAVLNITFGGLFGHWRKFDERYCAGRDGAYGWINDGSSNLVELQTRMGEVTVRRTKSEVAAQLPTLTRTIRWVEPTTDAKASFRQFNQAPTSAGMQNAIETTLEGKMAECIDVCAQLGRFVCFTHRRAHAEEIAARLEGSICVHGAMDASARQVAINRAAEVGKGIVATIDSIGTGVNLQHVASDGVMHSIDWVPLKLLQAEARLHRIGQTLPVNWIYIAMRESADEIIVPNVVQKLGEWTKSMPNAGAESAELQTALDNREHEDELLSSILKGMV